MALLVSTEITQFSDKNFGTNIALVDLYYSASGYLALSTATVDVEGVQYQGVVSDIGTASSEWKMGSDNKVTISTPSITIQNKTTPDGYSILSEFTSKTFPGQLAKVYIGYEGFSKDSYLKIFDGLIEDVEFKNDGDIKIELRTNEIPNVNINGRKLYSVDNLTSDVYKIGGVEVTDTTYSGVIIPTQAHNTYLPVPFGRHWNAPIRLYDLDKDESGFGDEDEGWLYQWWAETDPDYNTTLLSGISSYMTERWHMGQGLSGLIIYSFQEGINDDGYCVPIYNKIWHNSAVAWTESVHDTTGIPSLKLKGPGASGIANLDESLFDVVPLKLEYKMTDGVWTSEVDSVTGSPDDIFDGIVSTSFKMSKDANGNPLSDPYLGLDATCFNADLSVKRNLRSDVNYSVYPNRKIHIPEADDDYTMLWMGHITLDHDCDYDDGSGRDYSRPPRGFVRIWTYLDNTAPAVNEAYNTINHAGVSVLGPIFDPEFFETAIGNGRDDFYEDIFTSGVVHNLYSKYDYVYMDKDDPVKQDPAASGWLQIDYGQTVGQWYHYPGVMTGRWRHEAGLINAYYTYVGASGIHVIGDAGNWELDNNTENLQGTARMRRQVLDRNVVCRINPTFTWANTVASGTMNMTLYELWVNAVENVPLAWDSPLYTELEGLRLLYGQYEDEHETVPVDGGLYSAPGERTAGTMMARPLEYIEFLLRSKAGATDETFVYENWFDSWERYEELFDTKRDGSGFVIWEETNLRDFIEEYLKYEPFIVWRGNTGNFDIASLPPDPTDTSQNITVVDFKDFTDFKVALSPKKDLKSEIKSMKTDYVYGNDSYVNDIHYKLNSGMYDYGYWDADNSYDDNSFFEEVIEKKYTSYVEPDQASIAGTYHNAVVTNSGLDPRSNVEWESLVGDSSMYNGIGAWDSGTEYRGTDGEAEAIAKLYLNQWGNRHRIVTFKTNKLLYNKYTLGDCIEFTNVPYSCLGLTVKGWNGDVTTEAVEVNGQNVTYVFIVTKVRRGLKEVEIECMQLHKLDDWEVVRVN